VGSGDGEKEGRLMDYPDLIVRAVRILNANGIMHKSGHVAARDAGDRNVMWINSRKASRSSIKKSDIVRVDLTTGGPIGDCDEPPSEFHIHRAIFNRRPDVGGIVHSHPQHVVALSVAGQPLVPVTVDGAWLGGAAPTFDDARHINTVERGELLADAIGARPALVMRGHGMVVTGQNVEEAVTRIGLAEHNARTQFLALTIGNLHPLNDAEIAQIGRVASTEKALRKAFHYEEETARRSGAFDD
jgi:ribulose-5-phosphate 4-epimerase/fuculose-1-phosphate aldolase